MASGVRADDRGEAADRVDAGGGVEGEAAADTGHCAQAQRVSPGNGSVIPK